MHPILKLLGLHVPERKAVRYLSICSGIEAASTAWHGMGWEPVAFSEIEPFPCAVLAHHWPQVPNLGDMTKWREWPEDLLARVDVLVGGTPCQAFSVAGLRNSLSDERGNLTLIYAHLLDHIDALRASRGLPPVICLWENVPGVLSTKDNAFGCFLGALAGEDEALESPGTKWSNSGWVLGPQRAIAWRILDAQYFGVAQRRRRVFLVASARTGFSPGEVLFESEGVRRDSAPSRETGKIPPTIPARSLGGGGLGTDFDCDGGLVGTYWDGGQVSQTLDAVLAKGQTMPEKNRFPAVLVPEVYPTLDANFNRKWGSNHWVNNGFGIIESNPVAFANKGHFDQLSETETSDPLRAKGGDTGNGGETLVAFSCKDHGADAGEIAPTLRSMGHDGSHANGGGQLAIAFDTTQITSAANYGNPKPGDPCHPLAAGAHPPAVAFQPRIARNGRGYSEGVVPALNGAAAGATSDMRPCVAFMADDYKTGSFGEVSQAGPLTTSADRSRSAPVVATPYAVRRLTPTECERLQGFPDDHTLIPWRGKPAAECPDGPRYKALGNSMAVPCMAWIGRRIQRQLTTP